MKPAISKEFITGTPVALPDGERERLEAALESHLNAAQSIIERLDELDGDENLEPYLAGWSGVPTDDREQDAGDEGERGADDDLSCEDPITQFALPVAI